MVLTGVTLCGLGRIAFSVLHKDNCLRTADGAPGIDTKMQTTAKMKRHCTQLALALALSVSTSHAIQADPALTNRALLALFPGTFKGTVHGLAEVVLTASPNGALRGTVMGRKDQGRWKVMRNTLCIKLAYMTEGKYICSTVQRNGQWLLANHGGPIVFRKLVQSADKRSYGRD